MTKTETVVATTKTAMTETAMVVVVTMMKTMAVTVMNGENHRKQSTKRGDGNRNGNGNKNNDGNSNDGAPLLNSTVGDIFGMYIA